MMRLGDRFHSKLELDYECPYYACFKVVHCRMLMFSPTCWDTLDRVVSKDRVMHEAVPDFEVYQT